MLKNAAAALGKSSVRQIKTNGPKWKWLYGQERLRWDKEKKRKEKEESQVNFSYFGKWKSEMNLDRINLGIPRPCAPNEVKWRTAIAIQIVQPT